MIEAQRDTQRKRAAPIGSPQKTTSDANDSTLDIDRIQVVGAVKKIELDVPDMSRLICVLDWVQAGLDAGSLSAFGAAVALAVLMAPNGRPQRNVIATQLNNASKARRSSLATSTVRLYGLQAALLGSFILSRPPSRRTRAETRAMLKLGFELCAAGARGRGRPSKYSAKDVVKLTGGQPGRANRAARPDGRVETLLTKEATAEILNIDRRTVRRAELRAAAGEPAIEHALRHLRKPRLLSYLRSCALAPDVAEILVMDSQRGDSKMCSVLNEATVRGAE